MYIVAIYMLLYMYLGINIVKHLTASCNDSIQKQIKVRYTLQLKHIILIW